MQTNLKSDDFCGYNIAAAPFFYTFQPDQYHNTYVYGEIGVSANGGGPGSYTPPNVIDISSFLSGRDDILTRCLPPTPALEDLEQPPLTPQQELDASLLIPQYTKNTRSENDLSSINYNRWTPLYSEPQNLRHVIEDLSAQRGGLNTQNFIKSAWSKNNNGMNREFREGFQNSEEQNPNLCMLNLDPSRVFPGSELINGYPGNDWITGRPKQVSYMAPEKPPNDPNYPWKDITSQELFNVGASACGNSYFSGPKYDIGSCPKQELRVLKNNGALMWN